MCFSSRSWLEPRSVAPAPTSATGRKTHRPAAEASSLRRNSARPAGPLLGWAGALLASHPAERAALVADPALLPGAVEETLRYEAPSPVQGRFVTRDVELHATTIPAGSKVLLLTGSAGRDERKYPDADRYDVRRSFDAHVSLGRGPHFCLGASLARLEGRVALEETLARFPEWDVDQDRSVRLHTSTVRGYKKLPITV